MNLLKKRLIIFSLIFFIIFFSKIFIFIENNAKNIDDLQLTTLTHKENHSKSQDFSKLLAGEKLSFEFKSNDNNLGIISFLFNNYEKKNTDTIIFRFKEKGSESWYFEEQYSTEKINSGYYYTFGFPVINDSKNKEYSIEIESMFGTDNNSISMNVDSTFFMSKHSYPKSYLIDNSSELFSFIYKRINIYYHYIDLESITKIFLTSFIILFVIVILYFVILRIVGDFIKKSISDLLSRKKDLIKYSQLYVKSSNFLVETLLFFSPIILILDFAFFSPLLKISNPSYFLLIFLLISNIAYFLLFFKTFDRINFDKIKPINYSLLFPIATFSLLKLFFLDAVPRWDSAVYYHALLKSMNHFDFTFNSFLNFNWYNHPSMGFGLITSLFQFLTPYNIYMLNIGSLILGLMGIISFYYLSLYLFGKALKKEVLFLTTLFSINPLFFGVSTAYLPDFGVIVFFLAAIASFFHKRHILSLLFFLLLVFSKETGVYVYTLFVLFYGFFVILHEIKNIKIDKLYNFLLNIIPGIIYFFYLLYTKGAHWTAGKPIVFSLDCFFCFSFQPTHFVQNWYVMFILNFSWVLSIIILIFILKKLFLKRNNLVNNNLKINEFKSLVYTFLGFIFFFMVFVIYIIPSYMTISIVFLLIIFYNALLNIVRNSRYRIILLSIIAILFFAQNLKNIDFFSQKIFGTFTFGNHEVIKVASEYSCDGLIYNTEYVNIDRLINRFHKDFQISKDDNIIIGASYWHSFYLGGGGYELYIDTDTLLKTFDRESGFLPNIFILQKTVNYPDKAYYLKFPWLETNDENLAIIKLIYNIEQKDEVEKNGYKLIIYSLVKK
jgi:hypothetical protein